ncbi:MAG: hypothetical protein ABIM30_04250 [candidate division WOR-3 bacterium]
MDIWSTGKIHPLFLQLLDFELDVKEILNIEDMEPFPFLPV